MLAQAGHGYGWGGFIEPWEVHPALTHFPIAFLLGAVALDLYVGWRDRPDLRRAATGLLVAGVWTGWVVALAGLLAFFTVPGHTEQAHWLMYWHMAIQAAALLLFTWLAQARWRDRPAGVGWLTEAVATLLLVIGSGVGGYIVYHGGAGVEPALLAPDLREGHHHSG